MKQKLWQTGGGLHPLVESYTVGEDYILDMELLPYDIEASMAHAKMLCKIGILSEEELHTLEKGLSEILDLWKNGDFVIKKSQEDCHTAIEQYLTEHYGEAGKKIHTGRSRNDQVLVMTRLFAKESVYQIQKFLTTLIDEWSQKVEAIGDIPMPGYTHMQKAMPTTVATWLNSYLDGFRDLVPLLQTTGQLIDQNPLGSASGYGIRNFPLDREYTTQEMNFTKTQENPMYCGYSRGYFEKIVLDSFGNYMILFGKFANDMMLFTMNEFRYFSLPVEFTTGSSIMPQKRNYDVFEVMRANVKKYFAYIDEMRNTMISLGSGYHRDYPVTFKGCFIRGVHLMSDTITLLTEIIKNLEVNTEKLEKSMTPDLYVTEKVYDRVNKGESFRDAYLVVKEKWFGK